MQHTWLFIGIFLLMGINSFFAHRMYIYNSEVNRQKDVQILLVEENKRKIGALEYFRSVSYVKEKASELNITPLNPQSIIKINIEEEQE